MAVLTSGLFVIGVNQAMAQSRIFDLYIHNIDSAPVTMTLAAGECYEGTPGNGEIFENVAPGEKVKINLARVQGHGCDGKNGWFSLTFDPGVGVKKTQWFTFDNSGNLSVNLNANYYPGKLSAKSPQDESFTYTTFARPKLTAGKPQGSWEFLCQGVCNEEYSNQITNQTTRDTTVSEETKTAVSVALEAGLEFEGIGSAKTTVTSSLEKSIGRSMSTGVLNASTTTRTKRVIYTPEQMNSLNIFAVWQWVARTKLSNGQMILVKSDKITCTPNGNEPTYLPGSKEDVGACYGKSSASNDKPQDANPKPTPVETPKPTPVETPKPTPTTVNTPNYIGNLVGTGWTYNYGGNAYQFDFGQTNIENFSNGWWPGITWRAIGNNQIRFRNSQNGAEMTITFDSPNSYTGTDWDGKTVVSGNRRAATQTQPTQPTTPKITDAEFLNRWAEATRVGLPKTVGEFQLTESKSRCLSGCEESEGENYLVLIFYMPRYTKQNVTIAQIEQALQPVLSPEFCKSEAPGRNIMLGVFVQDMNKSMIGNFWVTAKGCPAGNQ